VDVLVSVLVVCLENKSAIDFVFTLSRNFPALIPRLIIAGE
jgi:hypothetical protein